MSAAAQPTTPGPDGGPIRVSAGTTAAAAVAEAGLPRRGTPDAIVVVRDAEGKLRDLSWVPDADTEVTPVAANTEEGRSVIRHSTAHVLAQAVQDLFPQAKLGIGPPITDGFYYDFDVAEPFTPEDLEALEKRMRQIVKDGQLFDRRVYGSKEEARAELDLFSFPDEIGSGLAVFHPKGGVVRRELEEYSRRKHIEAGYEFVNTPHITKAQLFHTSGHLDWYADGMFPPMHLDAELNDDG